MKSTTHNLFLFLALFFSLFLFRSLSLSVQQILSPPRACVCSHSCSRSLLHHARLISHVLRVLLCLCRSSLSPSLHHLPRIFSFSLYSVFTLTLFSPLLPARGVLCRNILPRRAGGWDRRFACVYVRQHGCQLYYGLATISRLLKSAGFFCRI